MKIASLFETPVQQRIEPVVKIADLDDEHRLADELGSTVVTDGVEAFVADVLAGFADTLERPSSRVGVWISGPFGSGKSHVAKVLALLVSQRVLCGESAAARFVTRLPPSSERRGRIEQSLARLSEVQSGVLPCHLGVLADGEPRPLGQLLLGALYRWCGYSGNVLYASTIEAELDRRGQLAELHEHAAARAGVSLAQLRRNPAFYHLPLCEAAAEVAPALFESATAVQQALERAREGELHGVDFFVTSALERLADLERRAAQPCRLLVVLDEASAWLQAEPARLAELQALVEQAAVRGRGRLWIVVAAHQSLRAAGGARQGTATDLKTIESRFGHRLELTADSIGQVVEERLLAKTASGSRRLVELYAARGGTLRDVGEPAGVPRPLPDCAEAAFVRHYPFLPYQLPLIVNVVRSLRDQAGRSELLAGSTRTLLGVTQDVLRAGRRGYLTEPVGALVSFDEVFGNLAAAGEIEPAVRSELGRLRERVPDATDHTERVAEVLWLLGQTDDVPATADNLARLLATDVDEDLPTLLAAVLPELERLAQAGLVSRLGGHYVWLSGLGRAFEDEVAAIAQRLAGADPYPHFTQRFVRADGKTCFEQWLGFSAVELSGKRFGFKLQIDGVAVKGRRGDVRLSVITPVAAEAVRPSVAELEVESVRPDARLTVWLHCDRDPSLLRMLLGLVALEQVIAAWSSDPRRAGEGTQLASQHARYRVPELRREVLVGLERAMGGATLVFRGVSRPVSGDAAAGRRTAVRRAVEACWPALYPKFERVPVAVQQPTPLIEKLLAGERPRSAELAALRLYDEGGQLASASPLLDGIRGTLHAAGRVRPTSLGVSGHDLLAALTAPPYGWDAGVVRVGVAALARAGQLSLRVNGRLLGDAGRAELRQVLAERRAFDQSVLELRRDELSAELLTQARQLVVELGRRRGIDETAPAVSQAAGRLARQLIVTAQAIELWVQGAGRAIDPAVHRAAQDWSRLRRIDDAAARVAELHAHREQLRGGWRAVEAALGGLPAPAAEAVRALLDVLDSTEAGAG